MINFLRKRKNRKQRRSEFHYYAIEDAFRKACKNMKDAYPVLAKCPMCDYQFSEVTIYRCLVFSYDKQPEIKCVQCNEIYPISNLIKIEEKTNVDTVNNHE